MHDDLSFNDVIYLLSDIIWEVDEDWKFTDLSGKVEEGLGFKPEELIGKNIFDFLPDDESERQRNIFNSFSHNRNKIIDFKICFISKSGERKYYTLSGISFFNRESLMQSYRGIAVSIPKIKSLNKTRMIDESRFMSLFENTPQGIAIADRNGFFIMANSVWKDMFGYTDDEISGLHINDVRQENDKLTDRKLLKSLFNSEVESYRIERIFRKMDGSKFWCSLTAKLIDDPKTGEIYVIGSYVDISDRKKAESDMKRFHQELETIVSLRKYELERLNLNVINSQENERQRIARDLHDGVGQTILAAKLTFESFIQDNFRDDKIFNRGMQLLGIASQELREIYSGLYPAMLSELGLNDTIKWYIRNYLETYGLNVDYIYEIKSEITGILPINIYRIIQELFNNIIKHSRADSVAVYLREGHGIISILISDNGIGFDAVNAEKKTSGVGIFNIRQRVDYLRGSVDINAEPGSTTFIIDLPVK